MYNDNIDNGVKKKYISFDKWYNILIPQPWLRFVLKFK